MTSAGPAGTSGQEGRAAAAQRPWDRIKTPVAIPTPLEPGVLRAMPVQDFARLLRDHLVPRKPSGPERERWERLWALLGGEDRLAERAFDVLEDFLGEAERALDAGELDERQRERARKFTRFCEDGCNRLQVDEDKPLDWARRAATGFNPAARRVLERLVDAIAEHRRAVTATEPPSPADRQLWQVLGKVGLDPDGSRRPQP